MSTTKFAGKWKASVKLKNEPVSLVVPQGSTFRASTVGPVKGKFVTGVAAKVSPDVYTGTEVMGIAVMHKSCLQPVFSQEQAEESAKMRRG